MNDSSEIRPVEKQPQRFATTSWSVILQAAQGETADGVAALDSLCRQYWYPLYAFVRRKGHPAEAAEDLTQGFFAFLLEKNSLMKAEQARGRFRTFLMTAMNNFLINHHRYQNAKKRELERWNSIDRHNGELRYQTEGVDELTPESVFDRNWAMTVLLSVSSELSQYYQKKGKAEIFDHLFPVMTKENTQQTYAQLAAELGHSESAVKVAIHRMREKSQQILRSKIAATVTDPSEIDEEIAELFRILSV